MTLISMTLPSKSTRNKVSSPIKSVLAVLLSIMSLLSTHVPSNAVAYADDTYQDQLTEVYFGVGCFWHIQHEFVQAERTLLGRSDTELTSLAGYAGGTQTNSDGRVCYTDYGKLGHGEVVGMTIPASSIGDFAAEYFSLFASDGNRVDPMDRGSSYRSLLGLPGGINNSAYSEVEEAANAKGFSLESGQGNDPDTLGEKLVYVMDSEEFPFYQAEIYHQYHNDFQSAAYGADYNNLKTAAVEDGRIEDTGCAGGLNGLNTGTITRLLFATIALLSIPVALRFVGQCIVKKRREKYFSSPDTVGIV